MTDSAIKGKRLDLHQVVGTYSHGPNNNRELKQSDFWSPEHPLTTLSAKGIVDAHFNAPLL